MDNFIDFIFLLGGLLAAAVVALMSGVGLFVWLAGRRGATTEAWPRPGGR